MYGRYDSGNGKVGKWIIVIIAIAIAIICAKDYYVEKEYVVTVTDKGIKNYKSSSKFLVFTKTENGDTRTFAIEDTIVKGKFNSSDNYADIEIGEKYSFTVIGWRIPLFSSYENVIEFHKK